MPFGYRVLLIALWPLAATVALLYGQGVMSGMSAGDSTAVARCHEWLGVITALYVGNFLLAWRFPNNWPATMARMFVSGLVAYLCINEIIYVFGEHPFIRWQIIGIGEADPALLTPLRAKLSIWVVGLAMGLTSVGVGFERHAE